MLAERGPVGQVGQPVMASQMADSPLRLVAFGHVERRHHISIAPVVAQRAGFDDELAHVPVKGAVLLGPLPKEIQNTTTYAAGLSPAAQNKEAAQALIKMFSGPAAASVFKAKGMEPAN